MCSKGKTICFGHEERGDFRLRGGLPGDKLLHYNNNRWCAEQLRILRWSLSMLR